MDDPAEANLAAGYGLTPAEDEVIRLSVELIRAFVAIVDGGASRVGDINEVVSHIHAIQNAVLSQPARRASPRFRVLGGDPPT